MPAKAKKKQPAPAPAQPEYEFRTGFTSPVSADTIAHRLEYLRATLGRWPSAQDILDDASNPASPIHDHFDWSDAVAANSWRLQQAGQLAVAVRVRWINPGTGVGGEFQPAFHSTQAPAGGRVFIRYTEALLPDRRATTLGEVMHRIWMSTLRDREAGFHELQALYDLIDAMKKAYCK
jgi:hypothetical protein